LVWSGSLEAAHGVIVRAHGVTARRAGPLRDDLVHDADGYRFEIRLRERPERPGWTRDAERDAGERGAVIVYRRLGERWYAVLRLEQRVRPLAIECD
jgi:hypothetical protein